MIAYSRHIKGITLSAMLSSSTPAFADSPTKSPLELRLAGERPSYLPPDPDYSAQRPPVEPKPAPTPPSYTPSTDSPPEYVTPNSTIEKEDDNSGSKVLGGVLTAVGSLGTIAVLLGRNTCTGPRQGLRADGTTYDLVEDCPKPFEEGDSLRTVRFLVLGTAVAMTGVGLYLLLK